MDNQNRYRISKRIAYQKMSENEPDEQAKKRFQKEPFQGFGKEENLKNYKMEKECFSEDTILIIESEKGRRNMLEVALRQKGYSVVTAASGNEGIVANKKNVDLVLLSDSCSDASVQGILSALKERNPVPVIVMISPRKKKKVIEIYSDDADTYLMEPIDVKRLFVKIDDTLRNTRLKQKK